MSSMINARQTDGLVCPSTSRVPRGRLARALLLALAAAAMVPGRSWGQSIKLSAGMPFSDVEQFEISPDGTRVVYSHDADTDGAVELWSVPITGGTPVRLSGLLASGVEVQRWLITPDSKRVVYDARQDNIADLELFQAPISGGVAPVKLSGPDVSGVRAILEFLLSPAGDRVVYVATGASGNRDAYSVPITGGSPVKLNPSLVAGGNVNQITVSPSGDRVVYLADQETDDVFELYSVPIAGGGAVKLNDAPVAGGNVRGGAVIPDGSRVIYRADQQFDEAYNLYSVAITGGTPVQLNGGLVFGGDVRDFRFTPDGSRVIYRADQQTDELFELYSVPVGGGIVVKLSGSQGTGGGKYSVTPDASRVLYQSDALTEDLYSVPVLGGEAPIRLNRGTLPASAVSSWVISPDSNWVVYFQGSAGLMMSPDGPAGSGVLAWGTGLNVPASFAIDPTSTSVVVVASSQSDGADPVLRLWQAPLGTLNNVVPSELVPAADFVAGGNIAREISRLQWAIGPSGSIVYIADQDSDEVFELYAIPSLQDLIFDNGFE